MSARAVDWSPLAESDPIGGDVDLVRSEAHYYSGLAAEISDQVARLRKISTMDELKGKVVDKLRSSAGTLADKLAKTIDRVDTVGSELTAWVPQLDHALTDTSTALVAAQEAKAALDRNAPPPPGTPAPTTPAELQAESDRARRHASAAAELATATAKFTNAVHTRDIEAAAVAARIKAALHDGLKDGLWDHISHWVTQNAKLLSQLTEILGWIVTALAVICIFIPVLNLIVLAATLVLLAAHSVLAATGNGSWVDVALDVFALATLGLGRGAGAAAKTSRAAALARAGDVAADDAARTVAAARAVQRTERQAATRGLSKFRSLKEISEAAYVRSPLFDTVTEYKSVSAYRNAQQVVRRRPLPSVSMWERAKAMGTDTAMHMKDHRALVTMFGNDKEFAAQAARWHAHLTLQRRLVASSAAVDGVNHGITKSVLPGLRHVLPGVPAWEHFKSVITLPIGAS